MVVLISACKKAITEAPSTTEDRSSDYFPLATGNTWYYSFRDADVSTVSQHSTNGVLTWQVNETKALSDRDEFNMQTTFSGTEILHVDSALGYKQDTTFYNNSISYFTIIHYRTDTVKINGLEIYFSPFIRHNDHKVVGDTLVVFQHEGGYQYAKVNVGIIRYRNSGSMFGHGWSTDLILDSMKLKQFAEYGLIGAQSNDLDL